jgi:phosphoglycolate phosphatase-like HAD superfamily hydrolase
LVASHARAEALLFELDGVLIDSRIPITDSINHALIEHGLRRRPPESLRRYIGPPDLLREAWDGLVTPDSGPQNL